ncbi:hypothetical protein [uncultured Algoriphagus sp.]|uniref:hypothetical protein n=1 Tax=uncultured Algoriphagus sp. TaxID=417365 RepID=UPI0030EE3DA5|tara:strand:+ start:3585 stop:4877 length:1293 start_codon:yes stop_codon:yes gene_type:complete
MIESAKIINPKRTSLNSGKASWYPYYAGYSDHFVTGILNSVNLNRDSVVLDPWNGSGTTTTIANNRGFQAVGYDLNPVMIIASKACLLNKNDYTSIEPICKQIIGRANSDKITIKEDEPLNLWLYPKSAIYIRKLERAIQRVLINDTRYSEIADAGFVNHISSIASFFYVALFRSLNGFLERFRPTNPTWIKLPKSDTERILICRELINTSFLNEVKLMIASVMSENITLPSRSVSNISLASSCDMPISPASVDLIISSPPYCTRIDYAVATMPELTLLGYHYSSSFDTLRRKLIGASTISKMQVKPLDQWGDTCLNFLDAVFHHDSKASKSYYYKSHLQYFDSIHNSILEIERALKIGGGCILVVQDSHYKDVYNNLPMIFREMAEQVGLKHVKTEHFDSARNMAKRNPGVKKYRSHATATESVLCLKK